MPSGHLRRSERRVLADETVHQLLHGDVSAPLPPCPRETGAWKPDDVRAFGMPVLICSFRFVSFRFVSFRVARFNARDAIRADPRWTSDRVVLTSMDPISFDSARDHVGSRPARDLDLVRRAGAAKLPPSAPAPAPAPSPASVFGVDLRYSVRPAHPAAGDNAQERGARAGTERLLADGRASKVLSADLAFVAPTLRRPPGAYADADLTRPAS
ncbi:hypothetical protein AcW1_009868 [Taiwanofungus camphoratus]|nr:hypothetical protein AcW1_009868 [Antrodia cinnamomea]